MTDYTAKIRAKGLEATGVTEELAQQMYNTLGKSTLAIVELKHSRQIHDADGDRAVELTITLLEPSTDDNLDAHLRELTRTMHQNRVLQSRDDQLQIETAEDLEPTVDQVIAAGQHHIATTDDELPDPEDVDGELDEDPDGLAGTGEAVNADTGEATAPGEPLPDWEYDQPEGTNPRPIDNPFATSTT